MNGRICQLCGKQLSRFAVGSGGDFCSREHRNQFRLRLGMDRLQEANKVANLMRRRENTKSIPAAQLAADCLVLPRVSPHLKLPPRPPSALSILPVSAALETVQIAAGAASLLAPRLARKPTEGLRRELQLAARFCAQDSRPIVAPTSLAMAPQLMAARPVRPCQVVALPSPRPRKLSTLGPRNSRRIKGSNGIQLIPIARPGVQSCQAAQNARSLIHTPDRGRDLRVSGGVGFRLPTLRLRPLTVPALVGAVVLPATRHMRSFRETFKPRAAESRSTTIPIPISDVVAPSVKAESPRVTFRWPAALLPGARSPQSSTSSSRPCEVRWNAPEPDLPRFRVAQQTFRFGAPETDLRPSPPSPNRMEALRRVRTVRFEPEEVPFQYTPSSLYGTLLSGTAAAPSPSVRKTEQQQQLSVIEDHFDAGLQRWLGNTDDWRVDVAGVRAGSLALFAPSVDLHDYQFEFLARIETRSVTWVFRAAGFSDYYEATLTVVPTGGYELRRRIIVGGIAEAATVRPVAATSGKTTVTLRTRVVGASFSISLDNQVIDTWNDLRLASGGVGFLGAQDDRARLYWVKLLPSGHPSKEHLKQ